jgi:hypothetical protein
MMKRAGVVVRNEEADLDVAISLANASVASSHSMQEASRDTKTAIATGQVLGRKETGESSAAVWQGGDEHGNG